MSLESALSADSRYLSTIGTKRGVSDLSDIEKRKLSELKAERKNALAAYLGVPAKDVYRLIDAYLNYSKLQQDVFSSGSPVSAASEEDDIEIIQISATVENSNGGYLEVVIYDMALAAGIPQYTSFYVFFESRGTYQAYRYNNYSGAWSTSGELSCIGDHCAEGPTIPQN